MEHFTATKTVSETRSYLEALIEEKEGISMNTIFNVEGENWGMNIIPVDAICEGICNTTDKERNHIIETLVKIDFLNASINDYFHHLAKCMAI